MSVGLKTRGVCLSRSFQGVVFAVVEIGGQEVGLDGQEDSGDLFWVERYAGRVSRAVSTPGIRLSVFANGLGIGIRDNNTKAPAA